jgi:protein-disulfide isomerase
VSLPVTGGAAPFTRGPEEAPVTIVEFSDFQCPYCRQFALSTFPALDSAYVASGRVRWVFINFPLTSIHPNAAAAAEIAVCAAAQNAFWPVHDLLYQYQEVWAPLKDPAAFFVSLADSARISKPALLACLRAPATREQVRADAEGAARSGAASTPTFYIEGGLLAGAQPLPVFRQVLDSILGTKVKARVRAKPAEPGAWPLRCAQGDGMGGMDGTDGIGTGMARRSSTPSLHPTHPPAATARNTSYSACVHAVIPKPRSRYSPLNSTPAMVRKVNEARSSRSP